VYTEVHTSTDVHTSNSFAEPAALSRLSSPACLMKFDWQWRPSTRPAGEKNPIQHGHLIQIHNIFLYRKQLFAALVAYRFGCLLL
jgi:hypothetical protein